MKRSNLITMLSLIPFIKFFPISSRIQPVGIVFGIRAGNLQKIKFDALDLYVILLCFIIFSCEFLSYINAGKSINLQLSVSLTLPLISFIVLRRYVNVFDVYILDYVLILGYFFFFIQVVGVYDLLKPALAYVISVSEFTSLGYRGVSLFTPEPSNVAFVYCAVLFLYLYRAREFSNNSLRWRVMLTLVLILASASGTALMFLMVLFMGYCLINRKLLFSTLILATITIVFSPFALDTGSLRVFSILESLKTLIVEGSYYDLYLWLKISGPRFAQNFMAYLSPFNDSVFGNIFDDSTQSFNKDLVNFYVSNGFIVHERALDATKANSYFGELVYEFGVAAFIMFLLFVRYYVSALSVNVKKYIPWILLAVIIITFRSTTTILTGWIILSSIASKNNEQLRPVKYVPLINQPDDSQNNKSC